MSALKINVARSAVIRVCTDVNCVRTARLCQPDPEKEVDGDLHYFTTSRSFVLGLRGNLKLLQGEKKDAEEQPPFRQVHHSCGHCLIKVKNPSQYSGIMLTNTAIRLSLYVSSYFFGQSEAKFRALQLEI
ncbi:hypothetical protein CIHG_00489 [Coccidioides immitis H538.4]|uniref:Uncharacterized protein n=2 Tax=Coccidioides immitis TaxID=5501 RepID=A0A0J8U6R6_COCIT|nr:hypothetical protein CIHG_00489 [Coccidioides immitis H538.4]